MSVYLGFLGFLALLRIWELVRSKANQRYHGNVTPKAERIFPWMVVLHTSFFILLPLELWFRRPDIGSGPMFPIAVSVVFAAILLRIWTLFSLGRSWNVRVLGSNHYPIISTGPYRYIRHPNYLVVALELLFIPLIAKLYLSAALLTVGNVIILHHRIRNEEAVLQQNPEWVRTMAGKPRFLPWGP